MNKSRQINFVNKNIRAKKVYCIDKDNNNIGILPIYKALKLAQDEGLDLVQVSNATIPTCKILDYSKFKYDLSKRNRIKEKKQRESIIKIKEIKFRPNIGENDLDIKVKKTCDFIIKKYKVKVTMTLKGRESSNKEFTSDKMCLFIEKVKSKIPTLYMQHSNISDSKSVVVYLADESIVKS